MSSASEKTQGEVPVKTIASSKKPPTEKDAGGEHEVAEVPVSQAKKKEDPKPKAKSAAKSASSRVFSSVLSALKASSASLVKGKGEKRKSPFSFRAGAKPDQKPKKKSGLTLLGGGESEDESEYAPSESENDGKSSGSDGEDSGSEAEEYGAKPAAHSANPAREERHLVRAAVMRSFAMFLAETIEDGESMQGMTSENLTDLAGVMGDFARDDATEKIMRKVVASAVPSKKKIRTA